VERSQFRGRGQYLAEDIWLKKHAALRLEVRDTVGGRNLSVDCEPGGNYYTAPQNVVGFRIGLTFR
jgi:hypothetical protein